MYLNTIMMEKIVIIIVFAKIEKGENFYTLSLLETSHRLFLSRALHNSGSYSTLAWLAFAGPSTSCCEHQRVY